MHIDEEAIREILELPKSSIEWKVKLQKLNKGNFKHNSIVTCEGGGESEWVGFNVPPDTA